MSIDFTRKLVIAAIAAMVSWSGAAPAQQKVHFPSLHDNGPAVAPTMLDGYLYRLKGNKPRPAVVFLHGCFGLFDGKNRIEAVERQWARRLNQAGFDILLVDSNTPRHIKEECTFKSFQLGDYLKRTNDAYAALGWLQGQPFIRGDRIGLMGWDAGGGTVLLTIGNVSVGRPASLPNGDFRAAVVLYPAICGNRFHVKPWTEDDRPSWSSKIPLLILDGAKDVWTPANACRGFVDGAVARGAPVTLKIYPDAYHSFDAPGLKRIEFPAFAEQGHAAPILGTDPKARQDALRRVPEFFKEKMAD